MAIVELQKRRAGICILDIITHKFCYRWEPCLVMLLLIDKSTKISFYYDILPFSLALRLRMKYSSKFLLNFKEKA